MVKSLVTNFQYVNKRFTIQIVNYYGLKICLFGPLMFTFVNY